MGEFFRDDDRVPASLSELSKAAVRVVIPVVRASCDNIEMLMPTVVQFLSALSRNWRPAQLRFVMRAGGGRKPSAEWQVDGADPASAMSIAINFTKIANAVLADIRVGKPQQVNTTTDNTQSLPEPRQSSGQEADDAALNNIEPAAVAVADFGASRSPRRLRASGQFCVAGGRRGRRPVAVDDDLDALLSPPADGDSEPADDKVFYPETPTPGAGAGRRAAGRGAHPAVLVRPEQGRGRGHHAVQRGHLRAVRSAGLPATEPQLR